MIFFLFQKHHRHNSVSMNSCTVILDFQLRFTETCSFLIYLLSLLPWGTPPSSAALCEDQGWRNKVCSDRAPPRCRTSQVQDNPSHSHFFLLKHGWTKGGAGHHAYERVPGKGNLGPPLLPTLSERSCSPGYQLFWGGLRYILAI